MADLRARIADFLASTPQAEDFSTAREFLEDLLRITDPAPVAPRYLADIETAWPEAAIEVVGERRELVIYTGLAVARDDEDKDRYDLPLVPMDDD